MKLTKKNSYIIYITIFLIAIGYNRYQKYIYKDDFKIDKVNITVGEIYSAYTIKSTEYCEYVYKVNNKFYKSGNNSFSREKTRELRKLTEQNKSIKFPIIFNKENPNLNFLLNIQINDTLELGTILDRNIVTEEILKSRLKFMEVKKAFTDKDDLAEYFKFKDIAVYN